MSKSFWFIIALIYSLLASQINGQTFIKDAYHPGTYIEVPTSAPPKPNTYNPNDNKTSPIIGSNSSHNNYQNSADKKSPYDPAASEYNRYLERVNEGCVLHIVKSGNKYGLNNYHEHSILPAEYDHIQHIGGEGDPSSVWIVEQNGKYGIFGRDGETMALKAKPAFDWIDRRASGTFVMSLQNRVGVINCPDDKNAPVLTVPFQYDSIGKDCCIEDVIAVKNAGKWGIFDAKWQKEIVPPEYDNVVRAYFSFTLQGWGYTFFVEKNRKWGVYNSETSSEVIPAAYDTLVCVVYEQNYYDEKRGQVTDPSFFAVVNGENKYFDRNYNPEELEEVGYFPSYFKSQSGMSAYLHYYPKKSKERKSKSKIAQFYSPEFQENYQR